MSSISSRSERFSTSGRTAGKLDAEEIALALDELDLEAAQLDEFYSALEEAQVDVVGGA